MDGMGRLWTDWWARRDSNPQPSGYEPPALTIELQALPVRAVVRRNGSSHLGARSNAILHRSQAVAAIASQ